MDITVKNFLSIVLCIAATMLVTSCEEEDAVGGDANSFTLARSKAVVEGLNYAGVESQVTAYTADRHNHPIPDGSEVKFLTSGGRIEPSCLTIGGTCSVTWNSQNPRPGENGNPGTPGVAIVLAYTEGEESFDDMNDNDAYDVGEIIKNDIAEPYFDHDLSGAHDLNEEFVDLNGNNIYDLADGRYNGENCIGDVTVCNRTKVFIWSSATIIMSGLADNFTYTPAAPSVVADGAITFNIRIVDSNDQPLPAGAKVEFTAVQGTVVPESYTVPSSGQSQFTVIYTAPNVTTATKDTLTTSVTGPVSGIVVVNTLGINVTAPAP